MKPTFKLSCFLFPIYFYDIGGIGITILGIFSILCVFSSNLRWYYRICFCILGIVAIYFSHKIAQESLELKIQQNSFINQSSISQSNNLIYIVKFFDIFSNTTFWGIIFCILGTIVGFIGSLFVISVSTLLRDYRFILWGGILYLAGIIFYLIGFHYLFLL